MKNLLTIFILLLSFEAKSQFFEGVVRYDISYTSNSTFLTVEQMKEYGTVIAYNLQGGNYRFDYIDGKHIEWILYLDSTQKQYSKLYNNDTIYWKYVNTTTDLILETSVNKKALNISGVLCEEVIFKTKNGLHKYYYNPSIKIDKSFFVNHHKDHLADFLRISCSIPIIEIMEDEIGSVKSEAVEIIRTIPPAHLFKLPANAILVPSPY